MPRYIQLVKFRKKPTKEMIKQNLEFLEREKKMGVQIKEIYWTLGRYDVVVILDAPNEKAVMQGALARAENMSSETMIAVPAEEARKLVE
jgi:uncharacterized protein with GYD domain